MSHKTVIETFTLYNSTGMCLYTKTRVCIIISKILYVIISLQQTFSTNQDKLFMPFYCLSAVLIYAQL